MYALSTTQHILRDAKFSAFSDGVDPETQIFETKTRKFVYAVKNGDNNSPFVALCFQRGQNDWYHNTGSIYGIYNIRTMELVMEIQENQKIQTLALCKHYLIYHNPFYPCKTVCVNLLTKETSVLVNSLIVNNMTAGANKVALFCSDYKTIVYDVNTKKTRTVKLPFDYCYNGAIYHDMLVCSRESAMFFFDINTGFLINGINLYGNVSEFSELSNGDLAVKINTGLLVVSFQQRWLDKRIRIQGIYQLENKCHLQEETVNASNLMEFVSSKVGGFNCIISYQFNASPTERYGIIFNMKLMGSPSKQKQLRNNYATRLLKKATNGQGQHPFSFTRNVLHNYYIGHMSSTKPRFVDGHAFLYYERQIDGRWELSSPSKGKPWPEK
jgi:hypothetical protein